MTAISSDFDRLHMELAEALVACRADSRRHAVHDLRTGTRKVEAVVQKVLEDHPGAMRLRKAAKKALRELKRVRKAAGPVRDLDVHRNLAKELREQVLKRNSSGTKQSLAKEFKKLDDRLRRRRKRSASKLQKVLKDEEVQLEAALEDMAKAMTLLRPSPPPLTTAQQWTGRFFPPPGGSFEERLHEYRKQTKAARYLAGLQQSSAAARQLENRLKQMQDSIGRWHDLMLLTTRARALLGKRSVLAGVVAAERDSALQDAADRVKIPRNLTPAPSPR
jgi:CHAD domain-containing protein